MSRVGPVLYEVAGGWAAMGDHWAVHAPTKEDALALFHERRRYYDGLALLPPWYEQAGEIDERDDD